MDRYTRSEAAWLLGLSQREARDLDAQLRSSWHAWDGDLVELGALPVVVLRNDVHAAAARVAQRKLADGQHPREAGLTLAVLALRGRGLSLRMVAVELGITRSTAARRFRAGLDEVLEELGGVAV